MSQADVLQILKNLGGKASSSEIIQEAKREFPHRSLHSHITMRLKALERRKLVLKEDTADGILWKVTDVGEKKVLKSHNLANALNNECLSLLSDQGIDIVNIVVVIDAQQDIDLFNIATNLSNVDYHPETDSHLTYFPRAYENVALRVPSSGRITVAGPKSKEEVIESLNEFSSELEKVGTNLDFGTYSAEIQNMIGVTQVERELDLQTIASDFGSEDIEYNPENFAGLIFRPSSTGTAMLFKTGKINLVGVKSCDQLLSLHLELVERIPILKHTLSESER